MRSRPLAFALVTSGVVGTSSSSAFAKEVDVTNVTELTTAIAAAAAGDEIVLASGTYHFTASPVCSASGTPAAPIVVRSATPLGARIEFDALEGFHVTAPNWTFEGLDVHGVCANDSDCEHGFHVTGGATGFVMRNNRVVDFNAQLKVNADNPGGPWLQPNGGLVEGNEVFDTHSRATANPVTKFNIDGADSWIVRANIIHDGHKNGGDFTSYQSFMKGGGKNGLYERNLVICSQDDVSGGTRIGLSFGGGGTDPAFCAPAFNESVPCTPEMTGGTMRNNIIVNCSDVGIYLNQSASTHVLYNTIIATGGVDFRFAASSGEADGNVLASAIRTRDGATMTLGTNLSALTATDFSTLYDAPLVGDLRKKGDLGTLLGKGTTRADVADDYCGRPRTGAYDLGALQASLGDCDTTRPPLATDADAGAGAGANGGALGGAPPPDADGGATGTPSTQNGGAPAGAGPAAAPAAPAASSSGGCGCRTAASHDRSGTLGAMALLALALLVRIRARIRAAASR